MTPPHMKTIGLLKQCYPTITVFELDIKIQQHLQPEMTSQLKLRLFTNTVSMMENKVVVAAGTAVSLLLNEELSVNLLLS